MKKTELKTGMFVILRNDKVAIVINNNLYGINWWNPLGHYNNLEAIRYRFTGEAAWRENELDIVEVYDHLDDVGITLEKLMTPEKIREYCRCIYKEPEIPKIE